MNRSKQVVQHMVRDSKSKNAPLRGLTTAIDLVHLRYCSAYRRTELDGVGGNIDGIVSLFFDIADSQISKIFHSRN